MSHRVKGWCPGALRPMASGDGLVVRVRPRGGRLSGAQARGLARAARSHGSGVIDLSLRGNVQIRGVAADSHAALVEDLRALSLIDRDVARESRRNITVTPFADAETDRLAEALASALEDGPDLPGKFGFVVDTGAAPLLTGTPGDIRLERSATGALLLRPDGSALGLTVSVRSAAQQALALADWFLAAGGMRNGRGRMAALLEQGARPAIPLTVPPAPVGATPGPGLCAQGALVGVAFGQLDAGRLAALAALGPMRVTPWRMLLIEGLTHMPEMPGLVTRPDESALAVAACTGAPGCPQAFAATRSLARRLAPRLPRGQRLHVSGCSKGCAHPGPADWVVIATERGFDLVRNGTARDIPLHRGLAPEAIDALLPDPA